MEGRELNNVVARTTLRSHGLRPRGVIVAGMAGMRANVRGCGERGSRASCAWPGPGRSPGAEKIL